MIYVSINLRIALDFLGTCTLEPDQIVVIMEAPQ